MTRSAEEWRALLPTVKDDVAKALVAAGFEDQDADDPSWADIPSTWARPGYHHPRDYPDASFSVHVSWCESTSRARRLRTTTPQPHDISCTIGGGTPDACPDAVYMHGDSGLDLAKVVAGAEIAAEATRLAVVSEREELIERGFERMGSLWVKPRGGGPGWITTQRRINMDEGTDARVVTREDVAGYLRGMAAVAVQERDSMAEGEREKGNHIYGTFIERSASCIMNTVIVDINTLAETVEHYGPAFLVIPATEPSVTSEDEIDIAAPGDKA